MSNKRPGHGPVRPDDLQRSRTGRVPQWVLDEAHGRPTADTQWRAEPVLLAPAEPSNPGCPPLTPSQRRSATFAPRNLVGLAVLLAIIVSTAFLASDRFLPGTRQAADVRPPSWPSVATDVSATPLGSPPLVVGGSNSFAFLYRAEDGVTPVGFDPCRPISYVVNRAQMPVGGDLHLAQALARVSAATGFQFRDEGATTEAFTSTGREPFQLQRYGDRWAPVLIAWTSPESVPDLAGGTVGLGGGSPVGAVGKPMVNVTGAVALDGPQLSRWRGHPGGDGMVTAVIQHELGHLLGLAHVADPTQIMYTESDLKVTDYGAGDRAGLAALGGGACAPYL
jgi:hypothetical protein